MTITILPDAPPSAPKRPMNTRLVAAVAAGVLIAGGGAAYALGVFGSSGSSGGSAAPSSLSGLSGEQIFARAKAAALQAGSAHIVGITTVSGKQMRVDGYSNRTTGVQTLTFGPAQAEARVIGHTTYYTGNSSAIHDLMQLPAASVPPHGVWYRLSPGDAHYKTISEGVTLASSFEQIKMDGPFTVLPVATHNGVAAVGVRGQDHVDSIPVTLWVAATGPSLPVEYDTAMGAVSMRATFNDWGKAVKVHKPTHVRSAPAAAAANPAAADAQMKINLRNLAVAEETYLTDAVVYATAKQLKRQGTPYLKLAGGKSVTVHLSGNRTDGFCLAGRVAAGRYFVYSSLEGGMTEAVSSDQCSPALYPRNGGTLRAD